MAKSGHGRMRNLRKKYMQSSFLSSKSFLLSNNNDTQVPIFTATATVLPQWPELYLIEDMNITLKMSTWKVIKD